MKRRMRKGQTMVEYIIIISLVAIALIAVFSYFGKAVGKKTAGATAALSQEEGDKAKNAADRIGENSLKELGE